MRKMFAEVRKMLSNARHAEQHVRERQENKINNLAPPLGGLFFVVLLKL
jgi:hypothetical protein